MGNEPSDNEDNEPSDNKPSNNEDNEDNEDNELKIYKSNAIADIHLDDEIINMQNQQYNNYDNNNNNNGWYGANELTIKTWKNNFAKMSFIYDITLQKYKTKLANVAMLAFIISSLQTTLSFSNLGISEQDYPDLALGAKITLIVLALIVNISNAIMKIYKWNDIVEQYKGYVEKMEGFFAILSSVSEIKIVKN